MARSNKFNKADRLAEELASLVGAAKPVAMDTVDFSDPNRELTCLEVDFPIVPINQVATIEGNAGKPIYQMSKWWARRRSSVFRSMLIAAATRAPKEEHLAAKTVWDAYYANHQKRGAFKNLKVADIFMGGGTTVVEGSRLGMKMLGNDLNPVAWLVVKNEMASVGRPEVQRLLDLLDEQVRPAFMPYYTATCPRGHAAKWTHLLSGKVMPSDFEPSKLSASERTQYKYEGPEIIHTFWTKHGPCQAPGCGHRTPVLTSIEIAVKELSVKAWENIRCECGETFDVEQQQARMAPNASLVVSDGETPFAIMDDEGRYSCPHCKKTFHDPRAKIEGNSVNLGKSSTKKISLTLFLHPDWVKGSDGRDSSGRPFGGSVTDSAEASAHWNLERARRLRHIEVRGPVPEMITCPETGVSFSTSFNTVPKNATFTCQESTCGRAQALVKSLEASKKSAPVAAIADQCYCPECDREGRAYGGRYFDTPNVIAINQAHVEWEERREDDLKDWWPRSSIPFGHMTHQRQPLPQHGYENWVDMFNPRQLLVLSQMLRGISEAADIGWAVREYVLGAFQQYLRNQNMFSFWHRSHDHFAPHLSNNNFHPKTTVIEVGGTVGLGYGPWKGTAAALFNASEWSDEPWEIIPKDYVSHLSPELGKQISGKSGKIRPGDPVQEGADLICGSSTELSTVEESSHDLVITDPPFGGLLHYSELSDFFYVWLRLALKERYPHYFGPEYTPKTLEAVANKARQPEDPDAFYQRLLTACWREAHRILKPGGLLAFTFHHSEDEPWVGVLESLFDAGFYLEATYPIRSDETKGEGEFGSKTIEYDIIHVCRKRQEDPTPISWARLRRRIAEDVRQLKGLLEQHQVNGLPAADLQVIKRGKALEYFSKHYHNVYVEKGREFTLREALAGIHQLLDDESDASGNVPPVVAEPFTRQFLRIFDGKVSVERDQMQKYLRGTGTSPSMFEERGWCTEEKKAYHFRSPLDFAKTWYGKHRKGMSRDFDQALFLVGACFPDSGIRVDDTLNNPHFEPHPAIGDLLHWMSLHGGTAEVRRAAQTAQKLYANWLANNKAKDEAGQRQFDLGLEVEA